MGAASRRFTWAAVLAAALAALAGCGEKPRIPLDQAPDDALVLGFPRRPITVLDPAGRPVTLHRAIPISVAELRAGTARVELDGGASAPVEVAQLFFLPGHDAERQLEEWRHTLPWRGYTRGEWIAAPAEGEVYRVELRLGIGAEREDVHVYFATGERVWSFEERDARPTKVGS